MRFETTADGRANCESALNVTSPVRNDFSLQGPIGLFFGNLPCGEAKTMAPYPHGPVPVIGYQAADAHLRVAAFPDQHRE